MAANRKRRISEWPECKDRGGTLYVSSRGPAGHAQAEH